MSPVVTPLSVNLAELDEWSARRPVAMQFASAWAKYSPRAKGAVPRWLGRRLGQHWRTTIATQSGATLAVDTDNLDIYTTILRDGAWEPEIVGACLAAIRDRDTFFDIGANAGYMSLEVAQQRPLAQVFAFEPQPGLAELIAISAALSELPNISVFDVAIGERDGTVDLFVPSHSVHASTAPTGERDKRVSCRLFQLDTLVENKICPAPNVIKIDVEGAELAVLRGAEQLIRSHPPVLIFEATEHSQRFGYGRDELLNWLKSMSEFTFYSLGSHDVMAVPPARIEEFSCRYQQVEFAPAAW